MPRQTSLLPLLRWDIRRALLDGEIVSSIAYHIAFGILRPNVPGKRFRHVRKVRVLVTPSPDFAPSSRSFSSVLGGKVQFSFVFLFLHDIFDFQYTSTSIQTYTDLQSQSAPSLLFNNNGYTTMATPPATVGAAFVYGLMRFLGLHGMPLQHDPTSVDCPSSMHDTNAPLRRHPYHERQSQRMAEPRREAISHLQARRLYVS